MTEKNGSRTGVVEWVGQVHAEARKVTWPTLRETMMTSVAVFVMVFFATVFLLLVDWVLSSVVARLLGS